MDCKRWRTSAGPGRATSGASFGRRKENSEERMEARHTSPVGKFGITSLTRGGEPSDPTGDGGVVRGESEGRGRPGRGEERPAATAEYKR